MRVKTVNDYYEQLYEKFPNVPKSDIKRIMQYGLKSFYLHNSYGADVSLQHKTFWMYCGKLMKDSLKFFYYYRKKLKTKLRILYKRNQIEWDGYYYFTLTFRQYDDYLAQIKHTGRPRKKFQFKNIVLHKIYEECFLELAPKAIFRIPMHFDVGFSYYYKDIITDKAELLTDNVPVKMKSILVSNRDYKILKSTKYKK